MKRKTTMIKDGTFASISDYVREFELYAPDKIQVLRYIEVMCNCTPEESRKIHAMWAEYKIDTGSSWLRCMVCGEVFPADEDAVTYGADLTCGYYCATGG